MRGPNTRAVEARQHKKEIQAQKLAQEKKREEDALWRDDYTALKLKKKEELLAKQSEKAQRKKELRELEEAELQVSLKTMSRETPPKLTRAQIQMRALESSLNMAKERNASQQLDLPTVNPNHLLLGLAQEARELGQEFIAAGSVDEFLRATTPAKKVLYAEFEEENLPRVRKEFPGLKRSQLKEKVWKMWLKSAENAANQPKLNDALS